VTLGIRTAAQAAENAAAVDISGSGTAKGGIWGAEANARARIIDIDPLHHTAGGEGGGVKFEALIDMVRAFSSFKASSSMIRREDDERATM